MSKKKPELIISTKGVLPTIYSSDPKLREKIQAYADRYDWSFSKAMCKLALIGLKVERANKRAS